MSLLIGYSSTELSIVIQQRGLGFERANYQFVIFDIFDTLEFLTFHNLTDGCVGSATRNYNLPCFTFQVSLHTAGHCSTTNYFQSYHCQRFNSLKFFFFFPRTRCRAPHRRELHYFPRVTREHLTSDLYLSPPLWLDPVALAAPRPSPPRLKLLTQDSTDTISRNRPFSPLSCTASCD